MFGSLSMQAMVNNLRAQFPHSEIIQAFYPKAVPSSNDDRAAYGEGDLLILSNIVHLSII